MKIAVTGATGFIGYYVIHELLNLGHYVIASSTDEKKARLNDWFEKVKFIPFVIGDDRLDENIYSNFEGPDILIHLAWKGLPNYRSLVHFEETLPEQYAFLKALIISGLSDLTVAGTCFEYGMNTGCLKEDMISEPSNPYGLAKNTLRLFLEELRKTKEFSFKWPRLFYLYGKGQNENSLYSQLNKALKEDQSVFNMTEGKQIRDFMPVELVAKSIVSIAKQKKIEGVINCSSNKPVRVKEFVEEIVRKSGKKIQLNMGFYPYSDLEPMEFWGDNSKLKKIQKL